jgi:hypothetical protein
VKPPRPVVLELPLLERKSGEGLPERSLSLVGVGISRTLERERWRSQRMMERTMKPTARMEMIIMAARRPPWRVGPVELGDDEEEAEGDVAAVDVEDGWEDVVGVELGFEVTWSADLATLQR